ncbi:MAG: hypothetical protein OER86_06580 [Phycisphaerae bacterium]|nr:hypothetical protein [Phycisphaerae bacterium]
MNRFASVLVLLPVCLVLSGVARGQEAPKGVTEIDQVTSVRLAWRAKPTAPTVVTSEKQLLTVMPNRSDAHRVVQSVNFKKQKLLIFAWEGDAQDRLNVERRGKTIRFVHWGNAAESDPHLHCRVFVIDSDVRYAIVAEPDPR